MSNQSLVQDNEHPMRKIKIEKVLLSCGATGQDLEKSKILLNFLTGMKPQVIASKKRIPNFNVRPGLEVGTRVTLRGQKAVDLLKRLLASVGNTLSEDQISPNHFSFGVREYIEIPGVEYQRNIGTRGLNVTIVLNRAGARVKRKKIKSGRPPKKQNIFPEEIIKFMEENFQTKFV